jgi:hypothetical protein
MSLSHRQPEKAPGADPFRWKLTPVEKCVAIFGGDGAAQALEGDYEPRIVVQVYDGTDSEMARLISSLKAGSFTHVIVLSRWLGHSKSRAVSTVAKRVGARFIIWPAGVGRLKEEIPRLVVDDCEKPSPGEEVDGAAPASNGAEATISVHRQARDAGLTVACFQERHDDCGYRGKLKIKCGCGCHTGAVVESLAPVEAPVVSAFTVSEERVLEVLELEPSRRWLVSDVSLLLDASSDEHRKAVAEEIASLLSAGKVVPGEATDTNTTPRSIMLAARAQAETSPAPTSTPRTTTHYAVVDTDNVLGETDNLGEAITWMERHPGSRLFREVRTRLRIEVLDE